MPIRRVTFVFFMLLPSVALADIGLNVIDFGADP